MPTTHNVLFGASIFMFLVSIVHLALVVQQMAVVKMSLASINSRTRLVLGIIQVRPFLAQYIVSFKQLL
jgi:hypothetical protein